MDCEPTMRDLTVFYRWEFLLKSSPEALWPHVTNTDRFNAAAGLPPIRYTESPLPEGGSQRTIRQRVYGVLLVYDEDPFEWIYQKHMRRVSVYRNGPLARLRTETTLNALPDGSTQLIYETWTTPRHLLTAPSIPVQVGLISRRQFGKVFHHIDDFLLNKRADPPLTPRRTPLSSTGNIRMEEICAQLYEAQYDPTLIQLLAMLVERAHDEELVRMRPFALAERWEVEKYAVLELFLRATRLGLLDLSWDMICPNCRGAKHQSTTLAGVSQSGYCPSCNIDFEVDFARTVEATFQVNPSIRTVTRDEYCIGNPQNTPHIILQQRLQPRETRHMALTLEAGRYRWLAPRIASKDAAPRTPASVQQVLKGQTIMTVRAATRDRATTLTAGDELTLSNPEVAPGEIAMTLTNQTDQIQQVMLGRLEYADSAVTAAEVTALQTFRDLFSGEALRPGESISVESLTILFTDLKGSTAMYRALGDAPVFKRVMDHFDLLRESVRTHHGALVKTIGDSIMAVFTDPVNAVRSGLDMLEAIEQYNAQHMTKLILKMGINKGACIAVTLNDRLDYFGSTVNFAARLEGQSHGDDIVAGESVVEDPGVRDEMRLRSVIAEPFSASVRGYDAPVTLWRMHLQQPLQ